MGDLSKNPNLGKFFLLIISLSLFVGFYFNEDTSSGGVSADFYSTWGYVLVIKQNLFVNTNWLNSEGWTRVLPLHYIILSLLDTVIPDIKIITDKKDLLRLFFCFFSLLIPVLFYFNLKIKFPNLNKNLLWYLASIVLIIPYFRSSAIWANSHITALIFFLLSILFFLKWDKKNNHTNIDLNLIFQSLFLALAVYTRQYYVIFFIYYLFIYFKKLKFLNFIKISIIIFLLSLPGLWILYEYPYYFYASIFTTNFYNTLLINSSMMLVYLFPIFFLIMIKNIDVFISEKKFFIFSFIFSALLVLVMSHSFDYNPNFGGGFFLKLSNLLFHNNIIFYFSSLLGFILLSYLSKENINNFLLIILIFLVFSVSILMQKWFEPTFLFIFFLIFNSKLPTLFLKNYKNLIFTYFYFVLYLMSAMINDYYQIGPNL